MQNLKVDYFKLLCALSTALDFGGKGAMRHHVRVALIAQRLAEKIGLSPQNVQQVVEAAIIHDIGSITWSDKEKLLAFELEHPDEHCLVGARILNRSPLFQPLVNIIISHHDRWDGKNPSGLAGASIPLASRIIHLADRVEVLINKDKYILNQRNDILIKIKSLAGKVFDPDLVYVLADLVDKESFWLDLVNGRQGQLLAKGISADLIDVDLPGMLSIGEVFAQVIDQKSRFTHNHSRMVSAVAGEMAMLAGADDHKCQAIRLAGLLHDLGKLAIPETILEKPGPLTKEEFNVIKGHTYYTFHILELVKGFEDINKWASYHHECLHGHGYPFKITADQLSPESRILAVSDIFTALAEDRPYRAGLSREKVEKILLDKAQHQDIDGKWVELLLDNYHQLIKYKDM
ncbi:HD domain-containing phosphohydrolase [Peptococcaceae bacterium 1198_IL3148]